VQRRRIAASRRQPQPPVGPHLAARRQRQSAPGFGRENGVEIRNREPAQVRHVAERRQRPRDHGAKQTAPFEVRQIAAIALDPPASPGDRLLEVAVRDLHAREDLVHLLQRRALQRLLEAAPRRPGLAADPGPGATRTQPLRPADASGPALEDVEILVELTQEALRHRILSREILPDRLLRPCVRPDLAAAGRGRPAALRPPPAADEVRDARPVRPRRQNGPLVARGGELRIAPDGARLFLERLAVAHQGATQPPQQVVRFRGVGDLLDRAAADLLAGRGLPANRLEIAEAPQVEHRLQVRRRRGAQLGQPDPLGLRQPHLARGQGALRLGERRGAPAKQRNADHQRRADDREGEPDADQRNRPPPRGRQRAPGRPRRPRPHRLAPEKPREVLGERARGRVPPPGLLLQASEHDPLELRRHRGGRGAGRDGLLLDDPHGDVQRRGAVERRPARHEVVERRAQPVDIRAPVQRVDLAARLLGTHVRGGADEQAGCGHRRAPVDRPREAEVDDEQPARRVTHQILRLDVAVDDAVGVHHVERQRGVPDGLDRRAEIGPRPCQRLPFDVRHRDVRAALVRADLVDGGDPPVLDGREHPRFALESRRLLRAHAEQELQGRPPRQGLVPRLPDLAFAAAPEEAPQLESAHALAGRRH
jgi:hypothetical protein